MKKVYTIILSLFAFSATTFSQVTPCVIDQNNSSFYSPSSGSFPCITRGLAFDSAIQVAVPSGYTGVTIDSIVVSSITGLPTGINYQCNPPGCSFAGGSKNCVSIYGTTTDTVGPHTATIMGTAYITVPILGAKSISLNTLATYGGPSPTYTFSVCAPTGITDFSADLNALISAYPNPNAGVFQLTLNSGKRLTGEVIIIDLTGRIVYTQQVDVVGSYNTSIDLSHFAKGLYSLQLRTDEGYASRKISIE